ncbi:hypothetical protein C2S53_000515 [Perilla frutescens var. hirtella]|uniref:Uncharacterized protein n=1 Tax=Perilla frutescens var. hirtella TaxID=608512 RepID=A0AAD4JFT6_PERFH|nr:hypothetical protein C2S53_000515 [Perilla frutescens var. hirtella]
MATEVLRPQDVLVNRFRVHTTSYHRRRNFPANGGMANFSLDRNQQRRPSPPTKHDKRRSNASAAEAKKSNYGGDRQRKGEISGGVLAMGQVTLLRRGESLISLASKTGDANPRDSIQKSAEDLPAIRGSDSEEILPKKIRLAAAPPAVDIYAGAGFETSPSPRCLPLPTFFNNKKGDEHEPFEDGATRSLRRMLRLE